MQFLNWTGQIARAVLTSGLMDQSSNLLPLTLRQLYGAGSTDRFKIRNGIRVCLTLGEGTVSPTRGTTCCTGDECNEIGLKFSPDSYLSTTVEYLVQKFFPTGYKKFPRRGALVPPLAPPLFKMPRLALL
ncbi:hypothetical protein AVEN_27350-1 [Araneus ventricosus]|uniref:Uncharacterized protein n=1 Tax=Araneus ventricosus TaxID=182803 RepID=A0A4Y2LKP0_ARAVE|nr:hypothetical protein AVEN_27350-1 [Araneus ventricosus]